MNAKVTLQIMTGEKQGERFEYAEKARVLIGRREDCSIILPEKTVSRYHCLLEINPPSVRLQDFGSLNGTFLNERKIGQRDRETSWEQAKDEQHDAYDLHDGDVLGLGSACRIKCSIEELEEHTVFEESLPDIPEEQPAMPEKIEEIPAKIDDKSDNRRTCTGCGKMFVPTSPNNTLCDDCLRAKVLDDVLAMLNVKAKKERQPAQGPSILPGYEKVSLLGKGGMGEVWKVRETESGKEFALKTMLPEVASDDQTRKLFLREAGICECLRHRNVVKAYKTGCIDGVLYILMDLCEGGSVDSLVKKNGGKLSIELATWITLQTLAGLDYVHNMDISVEIRAGRFRGKKEVDVKGIVHRDFKPGNIFLSDAGDHPVAMIADFGMAKAFDAAGKSQVSKTGAVMGTPVFMPRQQARDCKYAKPEVDVWAAAASYYFMLTGKFPKDFRPGVNVWQVLILEDAIPIRRREPGIPETLAAVIDRALAEKPGLYYSSAAALRRDLIAALPEKIRNYCKEVL